MINTNFEEGQKVYFPWFNTQMGKFIVLDRQFTRVGRCGEDNWDIMLCETWQDASDFAETLNEKIAGIIENRKININNNEKKKV